MHAKTIRGLVLLAALSLFCTTVAWAVDHSAAPRRLSDVCPRWLVETGLLGWACSGKQPPAAYFSMAERVREAMVRKTLVDLFQCASGNLLIGAHGSSQASRNRCQANATFSHFHAGQSTPAF